MIARHAAHPRDPSGDAPTSSAAAITPRVISIFLANAISSGGCAFA